MSTSFEEFGKYPPIITAWGDDQLPNDPLRFPSPSLPKYSFRLDSTREYFGFSPSTWVDQDESGDFDPKCKLDPPPIPPRRKRNRPFRGEHSSFSRKLKKPRTNTWQAGRYTGQNGLLTLRVGSAHGRAVLEAIGTSSNNWPHEPEEESEAGSIDPDCDPTSLTSSQHLLRKRQAENPTHLTTGPFNFEHVTLGHPAARGCKACLDIRLPCSLLQEDSTYPCVDCKEDDIVCELILPPARRAACESCKRRRVVCSYRGEGGDHSLPCTQCSISGLNCMAGPVSGRTRTGPSLDQDAFSRSKMILKPPKVIASCTQCRVVKKWCSFRGRKDREPPCKHCSDEDIACTMEKLPQGKALDISKPSSLATTQLAPDPILSKTVKTSLAHPITFNYLPTSPTSSSDPCHWCADPVYGLLGLGEIRVEVLDRQDGTGYTELTGGHTSRGHLPSRMCSACTLDRLMITACHGHEIQLLTGMDTEAFDWEGWMEYMMPGMADHAPFDWCIVCPSPAFFGCCRQGEEAMRDRDDGGDNDGLVGGNGCGLRLCESCAVVLVDECDGKLEALIRRLREEMSEGFGLRADAEFLIPEGELLRRVCVI